MTKDSSKGEKLFYFSEEKINLPDFLNKNVTNTDVSYTDDTNVIRVPFGKRLSKKKRPEKNQNIATLILPINSYTSPTPPYVA
tara:strand:- start:603 stop:851 length:249 start_codon:yes stop_codon:yes gene_type:complete